MPRKSGDKKSSIIATRLTPDLKRIVEHESHREGMDMSEWIRNLIIQELNRRGALSRKFTFGAEILEMEADKEKSMGLIDKKRKEIRQKLRSRKD